MSNTERKPASLSDVPGFCAHKFSPHYHRSQVCMRCGWDAQKNPVNPNVAALGWEEPKPAERKPVDVLAVMGEAYVAVHPQQESLRGDLSEARAAVAELVEAANALRGKRGAIIALTQTDPRSVRFFAALARCGVQS